MKLVGFKPLGHDSNVTAYNNGEVQYIKVERETGIKHAYRLKQKVRDKISNYFPFKPDAGCYSLIGPFAGRGPRGLVERRPQLDYGFPTHFIDHHHAHLLSAWPLIDLKDVDCGIILDGRGNNNIRQTVFRRSKDGFKVVTQRRGARHSIGNWFDFVGLHMFGYRSFDNAGKIMGAQAYGEIDWEFLKHAKKTIAPIEQSFSRQTGKSFDKNHFYFENKDFQNWLATQHKLLEMIVLDFFEEHCRPQDTIVYGGGCAMNTVFNEILCQRYPNLIILPHAYDGGVSLGCLEYLRQKFKLPEMEKKGFPYWQNDIEREKPSDETIRKVAQLLAQGKIVGWFQGRGEVGPRALGNRSILMDPTIKDGKKILNDGVKHREHWRPYAPAVLLEHCQDWFEIDGPSPYMLRAVMTKKDKQHLIPAVVHIDGTSRIQTVSKDNELFHKLISEFYKITGTPLLLNTSFNKAGDPIYATRHQCMNMMHTSALDAICMGDTLYCDFSHRLL
jgi:carbamoyltransferase